MKPEQKDRKTLFQSGKNVGSERFSENGEDRLWPVIIVGAGLAGLSAAYELGSLNTLVLEGNDCCGGRVATRTSDTIAYELGSVFAFQTQLVPFNFAESPLINENGPVGISFEDNLIFGRSVMECLEKAGYSQKQVEACFTDMAAAGKTWTERDGLYSLLNAFFRLIHPGDLAEYIPARFRDSLVRFQTGHYLEGNRILVDEYLRGISSTVMLHSSVFAIHDQGDVVRVDYRHQDRDRSAFAERVIVTAPAPVARALLKRVQPQCATFLESLSYGCGTVVVTGIKGIDVPDFSYIVCPDQPFNTILMQKTERSDLVILTAYFIGENSTRVMEEPLDLVLKRIFSWLGKKRVLPESLPADAVLFEDRHHWDTIGPIISEESYGSWSEESIRPSDRVFLAGDYTHFEPDLLMPYGMSAAILSGKRAARQVISLYGERGED